VASARRTEKLQTVVDRCLSSSSSRTKVSTVPYDASSSEPAEVVRNVLAQAGSVDMVILNAGMYQCQPALEVDADTRKAIMRVNYESPVDLSMEMIKQDAWKERGHGHLVVVASTMAHGSHSLSSTYVASKRALVGYFHSLSTEESSWLRVQVVCPGATMTDMWKALDSRVSVSPDAQMTTERVAELMLTGITGPQFLFYEMWISKFEGLLWVWLAHYTPGLFYWFIHFLGYLRVPIWRVEQADALDIPKLLLTLLQLLRGTYGVEKH